MSFKCYLNFTTILFALKFFSIIGQIRDCYCESWPRLKIAKLKKTDNKTPAENNQ
jgi:hypothetical protein